MGIEKIIFDQRRTRIYLESRVLNTKIKFEVNNHSLNIIDVS